MEPTAHPHDDILHGALPVSVRWQLLANRIDSSSTLLGLLCLNEARLCLVADAAVSRFTSVSWKATDS